MNLGRLADMPRCQVATTETPLEPMDRLTAANTGARLWVKRDDMQGLAFGGNKVRQLEYYFGAAQAAGADTVLITGAVQSNFCRLTAAYAARLGMECHLQLEERVASNDPLYREGGNVLLDRLMGAHLHSYSVGEDEDGADRALDELADDLTAKGRKPYVIHLSGAYPPLGALGYIDCAREVLDQAAAQGISFDHAVVASGSGATHSGFLFGLRALGCDIPVMGVCVRRDASLQRPRIIGRCQQIADLLGMENPVADADVVTNDRFYGPGYGRSNAPTERAIKLGARTEALMLDPVYTGKCMAGALALAGNRPESENVLFLHTGGTPGIFAYANSLEPVLAAG